MYLVHVGITDFPHCVVDRARQFQDISTWLSSETFQGSVSSADIIVSFIGIT